MSERKSIIANAYTKSFVEEYAGFKKIMDEINLNLQRSDIPFVYSYDDFCLELLSRSLAALERNDIFSATSLAEFIKNYRLFKHNAIQSMVIGKLIDFVVK